MKQVNKIYYSTDGIFIKIDRETNKMLYGHPLRTTYDIKMNNETNTIIMNLCPLNIKAETFETDYIFLYKNKDGEIIGKNRIWNIWTGECFEKEQSIEEFLNNNNNNLIK